MFVTLSERFGIALSDPGKFPFSGLRYCAYLITITPMVVCLPIMLQQRHKI